MTGVYLAHVTDPATTVWFRLAGALIASGSRPPLAASALFGALLARTADPAGSATARSADVATGRAR